MKKGKIVVVAVVFLLIGVFIISKLNNTEKHYGVSTGNNMATTVGMKVLENGGNAVDAAVAISYVLAVVEPYSSGLGGGGGMLVYSPEETDYKFFDYREVAPSEGKNKNIGIPGFVRGMDHVHNKYGNLDMKQLIQPAIDYAEKGFKLNSYTYNRFEISGNIIKNKSSRTEFYEDGQLKPAGSTIKQPELGKTLREIQENGVESFYTGDIANELISQMGWKKSDLENYKVIEREPVKTDFNGYEVVTAPAPFGGITLAQILELYEYNPVPSYKDDKIGYVENMSDIVNLAYTDRINTVSDPAFKKVNHNKLLDEEYISKLYENKDKEKYEEEEHESTIHFVVRDKDGMVVSTTNTISDFFGSGENIRGFFMNSTLSQFNYTNTKSINRYEVGKRPRTFMAPTIIKNGQDYAMGIGSPGGNRIPQVLAQVIIKNLEHGYDLEEAIEESRIVFNNPNKVITENPLPNSLTKDLKNKGYEIEVNDSPLYYGSVQSIVYDTNKNKVMYGGADSRRGGNWKVK